MEVLPLIFLMTPTHSLDNRPRYVVGFNFIDILFGDNYFSPSVVLIRKNKPEWQAGKLNGVGGKIEGNESAREAMAREYDEETGDWFQPKWEFFCSQEFKGAVVYFFKAFSSRTTAHSKTAEFIHIIPVRTLLDSDTQGFKDCIPNLHWLLPMAFFTPDAGSFRHYNV